MKMIVFYFQHDKTPLLTIAGQGPDLPEFTHLRVTVDETQNPPDAPPLRDSYRMLDHFGLRIGLCHWSIDHEALSEALTAIWWEESGKQQPHSRFVVTQVIHSDFTFTSFGELEPQRKVAVG